MKQTWYVYMMMDTKSERRSGVVRGGIIYTGITIDVSRRVAQHNDGKGAKFTRGKGPWRVLVYQSYNSKSDALKVEAKLKKLNRADKLRASDIYPRRLYDPWIP